MSGGMAAFVWVTLGESQDARERYHLRVDCHAFGGVRRVPTIEDAAIRVGLLLCAHCANPGPDRFTLARSASDALAEVASTMRSS